MFRLAKGCVCVCVCVCVYVSVCVEKYKLFRFQYFKLFKILWEILSN